MGLIEQLTYDNFPIYTYIGLPMLMMFIDPNNVAQDDHLKLLSDVASVHEDKIKFVWVDGTTDLNKKRRKALGLVTEILPSVAFNLLENRVLPFNESKPLNYKTLMDFIDEFLRNQAKSVVHSSLAPMVNPKIESSFNETPMLSLETFPVEVLTEGYDVCVLFYSSHNSEESLALAPAFNKVALRFKELEFPSVKIFRMDIATKGVPKFVKVE